MQRFAIIAGILAMAACAGPPRTTAFSYTKSDLGDAQAFEEKAALAKLPGVHSVVLERSRDGTAHVRISILDGREAEVLPKLEEQGWSPSR